MAEYKNGVNSFGVMSVEKEDTSSDIQTGRAVYVDDDKYSKDSKYRKRVDQYVAEGFHRIGDSGTPVSGGGVFPIKFDHNEAGEGTTSYKYYDHTWREVRDALMNGSYPIVIEESDGGMDVFPLIALNPDPEGSYPYYATFSNYTSASEFHLYANSADGYLFAIVGLS